MHPKLHEWLQKNGRQYAKLRAAGGNAYTKKEDVPNHLSGAEWVEFFKLQGQFEILLDLLVPIKKRKSVIDHIVSLEKEHETIFKMTGTFNLPKGYA